MDDTIYLWRIYSKTVPQFSSELGRVFIRWQTVWLIISYWEIQSVI